jgi:hypothetical protein
VGAVRAVSAPGKVHTNPDDHPKEQTDKGGKLCFHDDFSVVEPLYSTKPWQHKLAFRAWLHSDETEGEYRHNYNTQ